MKTAVIAGLTVFIGWMLLALAQLWFDLLAIDVFIKASISAGILLLLIIIVSLVIREYLSDNDLKNKNFLD